MSNHTKSTPNRRFTILPVAATLVGGWLIAGCPSKAPDVTMVTHGEGLAPELAAKIDAQVAAIRREPRSARQRAILGMIFEANKMWPEAMSSYRNATKLQPQEPTWAHHAAIAWLQTSDMDGATAWLRKYAVRFPKFTPLQYRLGVVLLDEGDLDGADNAFQRVIAQSPNIAQGYVGRGDAALRNERAEQAVAFLEQAVALKPTYKAARYLLGRAYRSLGRMEEAQRELTLGANATPQHIMDQWSLEESKYTIGVSSLRDQAASLIQQGKPVAAERILERVLQSHPNDVDALLNLGISFVHQNRLEEALEKFTRVRQLDDSRFETYIDMAACYRRMGRLGEALRNADLAVGLAPEMAQTHYARSATLMAMKRNEEALVALLKAEGYDARSPTIQQDLANVLVRLRRFDEALAHFQTLAGMLPTRWEPQLGLAKVNLFLGRMDDAQAAVNKGLIMAPDQPQLRALAAKIRELRGQ